MKIPEDDLTHIERINPKKPEDSAAHWPGGNCVWHPVKQVATIEATEDPVEPVEEAVAEKETSADAE